MRLEAVFPVALPLARLDLRRWLIEMTPADYAGFSPAHQAMGSWFVGERFFMVNVELIGSDMILQHYELLEAGPAHVRLYSPRTRGFIYRWLPCSFGVPWEMTLRPTAAGACELHCLIGVDFASRWLAVAAWLNGLGFTFLRRHLAEEGAAFARDLERKFAAAGA